VKVSDLSGEIIDPSKLTRLVIEEHPDFPEPITLEVLPEEIETNLPEQEPYVLFSYQFAGQRRPQRYVMPVAEFNRLFREEEDPSEVLRNALREQRRRRREGGAEAPRPERRERVDYASPEHAGEPHRGLISEAERAYVREHLEEVNARLREQGMREIDPTDPGMAERYGL
jgi:hypothetical protein